ncbi:MAG: radical SAM protein [Treponema sp.]|nr:radical SAM protein [Treponema sp.]
MTKNIKEVSGGERAIPSSSVANKSANLLKSLTHPCFNGCGGKNSRIHLPVVPSCNIQCNYCRRKYECPNESRPGVTARVLTPGEALERYKAVKERFGKIDVAGIAGPGDALADFEKTRETFALLRKADPDLTFCLSTNGLLLPRYAEKIAALGVSHVTVTVNAPDPLVGKRIYRFVEYEGRHYFGAEGATILLRNQYEGIARLRALGILCKVNIVMLKGLNDCIIPDIVAKVKEAGADLCNIMQLIPVAGTIFEHIPMVSSAEIMETRKKCEAILPQMYHCRQCRADAAGTLDEDISYLFAGNGKPCAVPETRTGGSNATDTPLFAVASKDGMVVDQHFGHASAFHIYRYENGKVTFIERREVPQYCHRKENCGGRESTPEYHGELLNSIIETITGCTGVIALRIGDEPLRRLKEKGIHFFMTYNYAADAVKEFAEKLIAGKGEEVYGNHCC